MAGAYGDRSLKETPTWAVALVSAVFMIISILIEHGIHSLGKWFQKHQKKAMSEALEKIKAELMLLGFISLLITAGTNPISKICIPVKFGEIMLPCKHESKNLPCNKDAFDRRKLFWDAGNSVWRRVLAPAGGEGYCSKYNYGSYAIVSMMCNVLVLQQNLGTKTNNIQRMGPVELWGFAIGKLPLMSESGVHQLHIFIFVLGVSHILYSVIAMALAQAKLKKWKAWELETTSLEYQFANDPSRFRFTHETSFVRRHTGFSKLPGLRWIVAFYRQFFSSVTKVDYLTMRHGFINAHLAPNCKFNFHQYIKRSMEDDFKLVVGISVPLWMFAILFQLLNVYRWYTLYVISFLPPILILLIGAKLQIITMEMAQQIQDRATIVKGVPVVEPSNGYFWLHQPDLILFLMHFTLFQDSESVCQEEKKDGSVEFPVGKLCSMIVCAFQNAFQVAYFLWTWYEFGLTSCFHENLPSILAKVFLGVGFQVLCSYITFPVYALVTQMGSHMKRSIFEEQIANALKRWKKNARERNKLRKAGAEVSKFGFINGDPTQSHDSSAAFHFLHIHTHKPIDVGNTVKYPNNGHCSDTKVSGVEGPSMASCGDCETRTTKNGAKGEDEDLETGIAP